MSSRQHFQQDLEASSSHQQQQHQQDIYSSGDFDQAEEPTTPRPTRHADPSAEEDSGSETETESSRQKDKRKKGKGKEKERSRDSKGFKDKDQTDRRHHHRHRHQQQPPPQEQQQQQQTAAMSSSRVGKPPSSSRRHAGKGKTKTDDWSEVTDPEERRRIQNRIAQRKFREKAREQKERAERDQRNQEHAASSYAVPGPDDLGVDDVLSGVPWGGPSLRYVMAKGHESASTHLTGSRRASDYLPDEGSYSSSSVSGISGAALAPLTAGGTSMPGRTSGYSFSEESQGYFQYMTDGTGSADGSGSDFSQTQLSQGQYFDDSSSFYYDYEYDYDSAGR